MSEKVTVKASELYAQQNRLLHRGFVAIGMPYREHKDEWMKLASSLAKRKITGLSKLTLHERNRLMALMIRRGARLYTPGIPGEMRNWTKGDRDMELTYARSDDRQIRYAEALWSNMGYRRKTLYGLCFKKFKKSRLEWLSPHELNQLVNIVAQKAKSKGMLSYYG